MGRLLQTIVLTLLACIVCAAVAAVLAVGYVGLQGMWKGHGDFYPGLVMFIGAGVFLRVMWWAWNYDQR